MTKLFKQHSILGACALMCLMGTSHASVVFEKVPTYSNIVCEGEKRFETYILKNNGGDIGIQDIELEIESGDSFKYDENLVKVVHEYDHLTGDNIQQCVIGNNWQLAKGGTCKIVVEINPKTLHCPSTGTLTGQVDRSLEIDLNGSQKDMYSPIKFKVTRIGAAEEFALLGGKITNHYAGPANVYQDIGCTGSHDTDSENPHCIDLHNIVLNDGAQAYGPYDQITHEVVDDIKRAYKNALKLKKSHQCTYLDPNLGGHHQVITSGTYCFKNPAPVVIAGDLRLSGGGEFVFIIDYPFTHKGDNTLYVPAHVEYKLEDGAKTENVYWFVNGSVETSYSNKFPGTIIATGNFESENHGTGTLINGRVLLIPEHYQDASEPHHGEIQLHGNTVINPESDYLKD